MITIIFTGEVGGPLDSGPLPVSSGDPVSGIIRYDSDIADSDFLAGRGRYSQAQPGVGVDVFLGGVHIQSDPSDPRFDIQIYDNQFVSNVRVDRFGVLSATQIIIDPAPPVVPGFQLFLTDSDASVFNSEALPTTLPPLEAFDPFGSPFAQGQLFTTTGQVPPVHINFSVQSLAVIPEPSTGLLLAMGMLALAGKGRSSRFLYSVVSLLVPLSFLGLGVSEASAETTCYTNSATPLCPALIAGADAQAARTSFETAAGPLILVDYEDPPTMARPLSSDPIVVPPLTTMGSPTPIDVVKDHVLHPNPPGNQVVGVPGLDEGQSGPTGVQFDLADPVNEFGLTIIGWGNAAAELSIETFLGGNPVDNLTIAMPPSPLSGLSDDQIFFALSNPDSSFDRVKLVSDTPDGYVFNDVVFTPEPEAVPSVGVLGLAALVLAYIWIAGRSLKAVRHMDA